MPSIPKTWAWPVALLVAIAVLLIVVPSYGLQYRGGVFLVVLVLLAAEFALIGWILKDRPMGAFIDNRNRISLSKLQAGAWTVVVLAGFATAAAFNAAAQIGHSETITALAVIIPGELLLAMGISATSLVATPGLLSMKANEEPDKKVKDAALKAPGSTLVPDQGKLANNKDPTDASLGDLFTGDELGNYDSPDLGKIQQAFITLLLLGSYVAYVYAQFSGTAPTVDQLPGLDKSFVWLMGISHASYLAYKAAPHTQSGDTP